MARRKPDPAVLRTVSMFTGKTPLEEAEDFAREEDDTERPDTPRDMVTEAEDCSIRWLGLDVFHEGDDVRVAVHAKGHAVIMLVRTVPSGVPGGSAYGTTTFKLSRAQWTKLKKLVREA